MATLGDILLLENGDAILSETGVATDNILLESQLDIAQKVFEALTFKKSVLGILHNKSVDAIVEV